MFPQIVFLKFFLIFFNTSFLIFTSLKTYTNFENDQVLVGKSKALKVYSLAPIWSPFLTKLVLEAKWKRRDFWNISNLFCHNLFVLNITF